MKTEFDTAWYLFRRNSIEVNEYLATLNKVCYLNGTNIKDRGTNSLSHDYDDCESAALTT